MSGFRSRAFASWRGGFAALALLAISVLLLRPVCDALDLLPASSGYSAAVAAADTHHGDEPCCSFLSSDSPLTGTAVAFVPAGGADVLPDSSVAATPRVHPSWPAMLDPPRYPPRSLRYHARTARILA